MHCQYLGLLVVVVIVFYVHPTAKEMGPRFKVSSERLEKLWMDPKTPGLEGSESAKLLGWV